MIYSFLNQKVGVGKTTLSIHLADGLARRRSRVLLIDADPQQTAMKWSTFQAGKHGFSVVAMATPTLHKELPPITADYSPPRIHNLAKSIILAADLVLIPVQPSPADVWATAETVDLVTEAQSFKETIKAVIVINRKIGNTVIGRDVRDALATLKTRPSCKPTFRSASRLPRRSPRARPSPTSTRAAGPRRRSNASSPNL